MTQDERWRKGSEGILTVKSGKLKVKIGLRALLDS
jgi:hypothetical protein